MSSYAVTTLHTKPESSGQPVGFRLGPWLLAVLVAAMFLAVSTGLTSLREVAVASFVLQLFTAYEITRVRSRLLSISSVFAALWIIYFPLRLLVITFGGPLPYYFPSVKAASSDQLILVCEVTTAVFLLFLIGRLFANRILHLKGTVDDVHMMYRQLFIVGVAGVSITATLSTFHLSSGILSNVGDVSLFAIAGASYMEATAGRKSYASPSLLLVAVASAFGYLNGFKLLMLMPVAAWLIGRAGAGDQLRLRYIVVVAAATTVAFGIIQGERDTTLAGRPAPNPIAALKSGLTSYDLASGVPADYQGVGIVGNVANGVLYRLKGADYYIVITDRVPSSVPYQHGRSLWEPALSILPGAKQFLDLEPQYKQLSLMGYADQIFFLQTLHPVAESMTEPGDLYLNFGIAGVMVGMLILGMLYGMFDRAFMIKGPVSAGVVAFAGLPLIEVDPNIAYILVTCGLRLGICVVLLTWISLSQRRPSLTEPGRT